MNYLVTGGFILFVLQVAAQTDLPCAHVIEGTVYELNSTDPLPFATITVEGTSQGTIANEKGHFILSGLCDEEVDLIISFIGYKTLHHHHDGNHENPVIYLAPDNFMLSSVIVEAEQNSSSQRSLQSHVLDAKGFEDAKSNSFGDLADQLSGVNTLQTGQNIV
ncbi:MAG: carboxypeptidase-like regulatory domain-containing protein, partial [Cyclobacteriaceae bacterium]|nr:carboxypeptidase-like regulatory domain-containing protein [Cyclobacteriaceae bacterium]